MTDPVPPAVSDDLVQTARKAYDLAVEGGGHGAWSYAMAEALAVVRPLIEAEARADERRRIVNALRERANGLSPKPVVHVSPSGPLHAIANLIERGDL